MIVLPPPALWSRARGNCLGRVLREGLLVTRMRWMSREQAPRTFCGKGVLWVGAAWGEKGWGHYGYGGRGRWEFGAELGSGGCEDEMGYEGSWEQESLWVREPRGCTGLRGAGEGSVGCEGDSKSLGG